MDKLVAEVVNSLKQNFTTDIAITVALSGGVDSVALLYIMHTITRNNLFPFKIQLDAIHINHGISAHAHVWADFCSNLCQSLNIELTLAQHSVTKNGGESLENNARKIRYDEFYKQKTDVIALAHHKTDQVETILAQILRGSDLHNIAAMRAITQKMSKIFWRPLLNMRKQEIEKYLACNNLTHIEDESNQDNQYLRNFIRNKIIPELHTWDTQVETKILKINEQIQDTLALTDEIALNDIEFCSKDSNQYTSSQRTQACGKLKPTCIQGRLSTVIDFNKFKTLSHYRQTNLISYFILKQNQPLPSTKQIKEFIRQLNSCKEDKAPSLKLSDNSAIILKKKVIFIQKPTRNNYD